MASERDDIRRYKEGLMSPSERHELEKRALSDPFLADALEGAELISPEEFSADLRGFSKELRPRTTIWFTPLRIAAGVVLLIGGGSLFYFFNTPEPVGLAMEESVGPATQTDSLTRGDSTSTLLTLAKPEEPAEETRKSSARASGPAKADDKEVADETKAGAGASGEIAQTETQLQPTAPVLAEEEKTKEALVETSDDKKELAPAPALASGTAGTAMKSEQNARSVRSKDAAKLDVANQNLLTIQGRVTAAEDGAALPGVNVAVKGSREGTVTDADGNYQLNTEVANPQLVFSYIGMHSVQASPPGNQTLDVQLKEDVSQLSEVVVTEIGAGTKNDAVREPVVKMAAPVGGLKAYNKYLENNLQYPAQALEAKVKGQVTVQFTLTTSGSLTEFQVLKGLGYGCDDEVIRLVKEGPGWTPTMQDDVPVESEVKVKMKFDPEKANR